GTRYPPGPGGNPVYVHSKAAVVDDACLTVGSANLNEHSLFNDTEANVVVRDPALAREVRLRLWEEHLERPREEIDGNPARVFDELWKPLAEQRLEQRRRQGWADGKLTLLPHVSRRSEALWGPLNGLFVVRLEAGLTRSPARAGRHCRLEGLERVEAVPAERGRSLRLADEERPLVRRQHTDCEQEAVQLVLQRGRAYLVHRLQRRFQA